MGGFRIEGILYIEMFLLSAAASINDIRAGKISNIIVYPFMTIGLLTNILFSGTSGFIRSLLGIAIPFILLISLYAIGFLGAGDIKLFCAIGSIGGPGFVLGCMAFSFLTGGVIAFIIMLLRKNLRHRFALLMEYIKNCFLTITIRPYTISKKQNDGGGFPFAPAAAIGTLICIVLRVSRGRGC